MKKAIICYPGRGGEKTSIEITDLHDIIHKNGPKQSTIKELQGIAHDYVLVLVECATESEHDVCFVYVVPVEMESGKTGVSAKKIRRMAREEFGIDVSSLCPYERSGHASNDDEQGEYDSNFVNPTIESRLRSLKYL